MAASVGAAMNVTYDTRMMNASSSTLTMTDRIQTSPPAATIPFPSLHDSRFQSFKHANRTHSLNTCPCGMPHVCSPVVHRWLIVVFMLLVMPLTLAVLPNKHPSPPLLAPPSPRLVLLVQSCHLIFVFKEPAAMTTAAMLSSFVVVSPHCLRRWGMMAGQRIIARDGNRGHIGRWH